MRALIESSRGRSEIEAAYAAALKIERRIDRSGESEACWPWTRDATPRGYGQVYALGRNHRVHRLAWILANGGPIPDGQR